MVRIEGRANVQATIRFGEDEHIENVAIGDSTAWQVTPNKRANLLFVKPLADRAATNMTVVTDRHTYLFDLVASPANRNPLYVLAFTYPEEPEEVQQAEGEGESAPAGRRGYRNRGRRGRPIPTPSWCRSRTELRLGDAALGVRRAVPGAVYDDGNATFLTWPAGTAMPAILIKDHKGDEGPVNFAVRGEMIVVEGRPARDRAALGRRRRPADQPAGRRACQGPRKPPWPRPGQANAEVK